MSARTSLRSLGVRRVNSSARPWRRNALLTKVSYSRRRSWLMWAWVSAMVFPVMGLNCPPPPGRRDLKLQHARPRPPAPGPFPLPYHPVHVLPVGEFQLHLHVRFTDVNKVVDSPSPRLSPQCPCHRIQQRRFTVSVVAADTGYVDPLSASSGSGTSR